MTVHFLQTKVTAITRKMRQRSRRERRKTVTMGGRASTASKLPLILTNNNVPEYRGPCMTTPIILKQPSEDDCQGWLSYFTNLTYDVQLGTARSTYCTTPEA